MQRPKSFAAAVAHKGSPMTPRGRGLPPLALGLVQLACMSHPALVRTGHWPPSWAGVAATALGPSGQSLLRASGSQHRIRPGHSSVTAAACPSHGHCTSHLPLRRARSIPQHGAGAAFWVGSLTLAGCLAQGRPASPTGHSEQRVLYKAGTRPRGPYERRCRAPPQARRQAAATPALAKAAAPRGRHWKHNSAAERSYASHLLQHKEMEASSGRGSPSLRGKGAYEGEPTQAAASEHWGRGWGGLFSS